MNADIASVVARALAFVAAFQGAGAAICAISLGSHLERSARAIRQLATCAASAGILFVLLHYLLEAARMAGDFSGVFDVGLQRISLGSTLSVAAGLRILALVLVLVGMRTPGRSANVASVTAALVLAVSFTMVGHTTEEGVARWSSFALVVHVLVVLFWFGSLVPLLLITRMENPERAAGVVAAFTKTATLVVPLLFVAGLALTIAIVGSWAVFREIYGQLLLAKVTGFVLLMVLASLNKWRYGPRIASEPAALRSLQRSMLAELVIVIAVLSITATMTSLYSPSS